MSFCWHKLFSGDESYPDWQSISCWKYAHVTGWEKEKNLTFPTFISYCPWRSYRQPYTMLWNKNVLQENVWSWSCSHGWDLLSLSNTISTTFHDDDEGYADSLDNRYCLLSGKSQQIYETLFQLIIDKAAYWLISVGLNSCQISSSPFSTL